MKKLIILCILMLAMLNIYSQTNKEQRQQKKIEKFNAVRTIIETKHYEFSASRELPQKGGSIDLTSNSGNLIVKDSVAVADMPYFGRAYNVAYAGSGGIKFNGTIINYSVKVDDKKNNLIISFKVKENSDLFECNLTLNAKDNATLTVMSSQRDTISYYGEIKALETGN